MTSDHAEVMKEPPGRRAVRAGWRKRRHSGARRTCTAVTCATFPQAVHAPSGPVLAAAHPPAAMAATTAAMTPGTMAVRIRL